jgi:short-subunit dehydrogenase
MSFIGLPKGATYAATKACERLFGETLFYELRDKVDVLTFTPGFVDTKLLADVRKDRGFLPLTVKAEDAVRAMHRDLGRSVTSCGSAKHSVFYFLANYAPLKHCVLSWIARFGRESKLE